MRNLIDALVEARLVAQLPADPLVVNQPRAVTDALFSRVQPTPVAAPQLLAWSNELAESLGLLQPTETTPLGRRSLAILAGNATAAGVSTVATRYGGHQFGNWAGQLGDGRAILIGECVSAAGERWELQLKGAGPTPYSRFADGRAVLRSSLREYVCSEAMHALGVPSTRALSLLATGESVVRDMFYDGRPAAEPGAIVCRAAPSFLRFGHFEILAASDELALLRQLVEHTIRHHFPHLDAEAPDSVIRWFEEVCERTALLIAHWMRVGFIHGVMNTDNLSILGLTIDYGPYGWLEGYDPRFTPNTTDAEGRRYAYGQQPQVALWNLARLAGALLPLIGELEPLQAALERYRSTYELQHRRMLAAKLGLDDLSHEGDERLLEEMYALLGLVETDVPLFFRALASSDPWSGISAAIYLETSLTADLIARWQAWLARYRQRVLAEGHDERTRVSRMNGVNPCYLPRNYLLQQAIDAATTGDLAPLHALLRVLQKPYDEQSGAETYAARRPDWARDRAGCSALSCSS